VGLALLRVLRLLLLLLLLCKPVVSLRLLLQGCDTKFCAQRVVLQG
jgi:hypothetical protein